MSYHGDINLGDTIDVKFTTTDTAGAPTTLAGTPVISAYPGNSATQITAGITLSVDFDGLTGLHNVRVVASSGNGYATATNYTLVITTGTVGGSSVVGYVVGSFSIENRVLNAAKIASNAITSAKIADGAITAAKIATDAIDADALAADALAEINAQADLALSDYDAPTKAELDAGLAALNDLSAAEVKTQVDASFTTQIADSVPADGTIATREQALYMIVQMLTEMAVSGTTLTVKKADGSTTLFSLTLNDGTNPTSISRTT